MCSGVQKPFVGSMNMRTKMTYRRGGSSIIAVFFVTLFSVLALSFTSMSTVNVCMARNQRDIASAQAAADSGMAYAQFLVTSYNEYNAVHSVNTSSHNTVSLTEAQNTFNSFATYVQTTLANSPVLGGHGVAYSSTNYTLKIPTSGNISLSSVGSSAGFNLYFFFDNATQQIVAKSTGTLGQTTRGAQLFFPVTKDNTVLAYACASRGRMWLTGDTTVHGPVFSAWKWTSSHTSPDISPFNVTSGVTIEGSINTVLTQQQIENAPYHFESYDTDGNPINTSGDEINGTYQGIGYEKSVDKMSGMNISDYNTTEYKTGLTNIPTAGSTIVEYFPHAAMAAGGYSMPRDGTPTNTTDRRLTRSLYQNTTYNNVILPNNRNALFKNCTFNGILYVDCGTASSTTSYNNVRFENCVFNGTIISNTPQVFKWMYNTLYFTGSAAFNNQSNVQEATILAPHFNVNLGNTNPNDADHNVLTGAIIGGIVDIRGNADIYGTILSMCDTSQWSSGYVSNIGATLADGGSETVEVGDVGTINITPNPNNMLPSGMTTPFVIKCQTDTYTEF
jgi:Tfp pilus assembly protein PilX